MFRRILLLLLTWCISTCGLCAQDLAGIEIHGFGTQGFLFSSHNNYLTMQSSSGSLEWTDGALSLTNSLTDNLRAGLQLHMYQLGQLGGPNLKVDWASGDYKVNDRFAFRAGKVKTVMGLFNDSQDVDAVFLWTLLPQGCYPIDNESFFLAHLGGDIYGGLSLGERAGKLRYDGYLGQVSLDMNGGYVKALEDAGLVVTTAPAGKTYGGDLRWETPFTGLIVGSSVGVEVLNGTAIGATMHVAPFHITAQYAQFTKGKFYFAGEYDKAPYTALIATAQAATLIPSDPRGWYLMGSYRINKKLQAGSYYSYYVNKSLDISLPANYSKDFVLSERYDFNSYFYGKLEGHFLHGTGIGYYESTNPNGLKPNSNMLAAKIGFNF